MPKLKKRCWSISDIGPSSIHFLTTQSVFENSTAIWHRGVKNIIKMKLHVHVCMHYHILGEMCQPYVSKHHNLLWSAFITCRSKSYMICTRFWKKYSALWLPSIVGDSISFTTSIAASYPSPSSRSHCRHWQFIRSCKICSTGEYFLNYVLLECILRNSINTNILKKKSLRRMYMYMLCNWHTGIKYYINKDKNYLTSKNCVDLLFIFLINVIFIHTIAAH